MTRSALGDAVYTSAIARHVEVSSSSSCLRLPPRLPNGDCLEFHHAATHETLLASTSQAASRPSDLVIKIGVDCPSEVAVHSPFAKRSRNYHDPALPPNHLGYHRPHEGLHRTPPVYPAMSVESNVASRRPAVLWDFQRASLLRVRHPAHACVGIYNSVLATAPWW